MTDVLILAQIGDKALIPLQTVAISLQPCSDP